MDSSEAAETLNKSETEPVFFDLEPNESNSKLSSLSPRTILNAIGSRFFATTTEEMSETEITESKTMVIHEVQRRILCKQRPKKEQKHSEKESEKNSEKHTEKPTDKPTWRVGKNGKKYLLHLRIKELQQKHTKPIDRDLRRFKAKYNSSMGNIIRDWLSLIYCILILRMNLIKFVLTNLPDQTEEELQLHKQILLESKILFNMIRNAQTSSQERFLFLWTQLEKLIYNRKVFKNGVQALQMKEPTYRDWKAADAKLIELQTEHDTLSDSVKAARQSRLEAEATTKDTIVNLEKLADSKDAEFKQLVEKITELKKREVQMRGRILINLKSYKDLKAKKQKLMNVEEKMGKLKKERNATIEEYTSKIQALTSEIEEKERLILEEREQKRKLRASLEGFGDYSERPSFTI